MSSLWLWKLKWKDYSPEIKMASLNPFFPNAIVSQSRWVCFGSGKWPGWTHCLLYLGPNASLHFCPYWFLHFSLKEMNDVTSFKIREERRISANSMLGSQFTKLWSCADKILRVGLLSTPSLWIPLGVKVHLMQKHRRNQKINCTASGSWTRAGKVRGILCWYQRKGLTRFNGNPLISVHRSPNLYYLKLWDLINNKVLTINQCSIWQIYWLFLWAKTR